MDEIDATRAFQEFRTEMLKQIDLFHLKKHTWKITKAWQALRDPIVFKDPAKYLEMLRDSGLFPDDFIESLFYYKPEQVEFTPYLASEEERGKKFSIISDSINGERIYPYQNRLYPEHLKISDRSDDSEDQEIGSRDPSTDSIYRLYNKLIPQPEVFNTYIPRPHFFYDVLYPSLAENFVECWIQDVIFNGKDWKAIKSIYGFQPLQDFQKYPKLYERFDLYYLRENTLFCIDVKAWSKEAGKRLSKDALDKTENKLKAIVSDYPEFSIARGLILNLHADQEKNQQHSPILFSGNLIFFDDRNCPVESHILKDFLFYKEK